MCESVPREKCGLVPREQCQEVGVTITFLMIIIIITCLITIIAITTMMQVAGPVEPGKCRTNTRLACNNQPRQKCGKTVS